MSIKGVAAGVAAGGIVGGVPGALIGGGVMAGCAHFVPIGDPRGYESPEQHVDSSADDERQRWTRDRG